MFNPLVYLRKRKRELEQEEIEEARQFYLGLLKQNREKIEETAMGLVEKAFNKLPNIKEERSKWSKDYENLFGKFKREIKELLNDIEKYEDRKFPVRKLQEILTQPEASWPKCFKFESEIEFPVPGILIYKKTVGADLLNFFSGIGVYVFMDSIFEEKIRTSVYFQSNFLCDNNIIPFDYNLKPENNKLDVLKTQGNPKIEYGMSNGWVENLYIILEYKSPINEKPYKPLRKGIDHILKGIEKILSE